LGSGEQQEGYDLLTPEELAAEKLQQRRENMKRQLDDAVRSGDEKLATKLLRRIQRFDDGEEDEEDEDP
jgi:phage shock protein A